MRCDYIRLGGGETVKGTNIYREESLGGSKRGETQENKVDNKLAI